LIGWATGLFWLAAAGLVTATALAGAFAVYLIVSERRRHESAEDALQAQTSFLESLVDSIAVVSSPLEARRSSSACARRPSGSSTHAKPASSPRPRTRPENRG
jgi:hypothetical protein